MPSTDRPEPNGALDRGGHLGDIARALSTTEERGGARHFLRLARGCASARRGVPAHAGPSVPSRWISAERPAR